ncbi:MAG: hypothetical protein A2283_23850 [Lentisphaerae bacterium RIFOXYA12_FULL_48_11]|nr:MAG: hypothetical protein A2283_23850 [Lentisphaerae bacterium RIFOXYA12_FULL_48_11]
MAAKVTKKIQMETASPQQEHEIDMVKAVKLLQEIAVIINNTLKHYWFSQRDAESDMADCYKSLNVLLAECPQITVRIVGGAPTINGNHVELKDSILDYFVVHLADVGIDNFYIVEGVTSAEFIKFCDIISASRDEIKQLGGFSAVLDKFELKKIRTKKLIVREIADAEVVLTKTEYERITSGEGKGDGSYGEILAFLKGDLAVKDESLATKIKETASDSERMAELILQAADVRQKANLEGGETLSDFIVGSLRRTYEEIAKDPAMKTQSGRKKAARNFIMLEEAILKRMREMKDEQVSEADLEAIASAAEDITDEIKIDAMADEYIGKVEAFQESQDKLMKFLKMEGVDSPGSSVIQKKLAERGISLPGWQEFVVKSGGKDGGSGGAGSGFSNAHIIEAIGRLDTLLDNMEKEFSKMSKAQQDENALKMWNILEDVNREVQRLVTRTDTKINNLVDVVRTDTQTVDRGNNGGIDSALTRKQILDSIAEILSDIVEPLELIRTSLDLVTSKAFGSNAEIQANVVRLAMDNADLMKNLLEKLRFISGDVSAVSSNGSVSGK